MLLALWRLAVLACLIALVFYVYYRGRAPYAVVREAQFRVGELPLPLDEASRRLLLGFLRAGGQTWRVGQDLVDPGAEARYDLLLARLSNPALLCPDALIDGTFAAWFRPYPVRQVIDARRAEPPPVDPYAVTDGAYWWIFYPEGGRLASLLVVRALEHGVG